MDSTHTIDPEGRSVDEISSHALAAGHERKQKHEQRHEQSEAAKSHVILPRELVIPLFLDIVVYKPRCRLQTVGVMNHLWESVSPQHHDSEQSHVFLQSCRWL